MRLFFLCLSLTILTLFLHAQNDTIAHWGFDELSGLKTKESRSGKTFSITSRTDDSERVEAIAGMGLRTDGYTNWVEGNLPVEFPSHIISVSGWIALESYPGSAADIWSAMDPKDFSGLRIGITRFGKVECQFSVNGFPIIITSRQPLSHNKWHFIVATINTAAGRVCLYIDGELVQKKTIEKGNIKWQFKEQYIGRSSKEEKFLDMFPVNVLNGIIDEVVLWRNEMDASFIKYVYLKQNPLQQPDMNTPSGRFAEDFHRPKYHAIPKSGWTNEPHGLVYFDSIYHFFNQKNANGPFLRNINWGHQTSKDLLHWKDTATVLWPESGYDQLNIWSGHLIINNGVPTIFYTGVDAGYKQTICMAYSKDSLKTFIKHPSNPLIIEPPSEYMLKEFRDPYVFRENNTWYMIIGSGISTVPAKGTALLYKSQDLIKWNYISPLIIGDPANDETGVFWELPVFQKLGDKYILMINRVPLPGVPAKTLYWTGKFEKEKFIPDRLLPRKLELINWFLVPCINYDEEGRLIAIGFIADHVPLSKQYKQGWTHTFSLPRVWHLKNDSILIQSPHPYLKKLRKSKVVFNNITLFPSGSNFLERINGFQLEIEAKISRINAMQAGFVVGKSPDNKEYTRIYYDYNSARIVVDRTKSSMDTTLRGPLISERFVLPDTKEIEWRVFIDGSVIEVFINNESAFTTRIFPTNKESKYVDFFVKGGTANATVNVWELKLDGL